MLARIATQNLKIALVATLSLWLPTAVSCTGPTRAQINRNATPLSEIHTGLQSMIDGASANETTSDLASVMSQNAALLAQTTQDTPNQTNTPTPNTLEANLDPLLELGTPADPNPLLPESNIAATPEPNLQQPTPPLSQDMTTRVIEQTPQQRKAQLIEELASMLRVESRTSATPADSLTQLAALETLEPGILTDALLQSGSLTQREQEVATSWRAMLRAVGQSTRSAAG